MPAHRNRGRVGASDIWNTSRNALEPPRLRSEAFALVGPDTRLVSFAATRAMEVAAMVRNALGRAVRIAGLDEHSRSELMGTATRRAGSGSTRSPMSDTTGATVASGG